MDYFRAALCSNGHVISSLLLVKDTPDKYCESCSAEVHVKCPSCGTALRGSPALGTYVPYKVPYYCRECSAAYPWTTRILEATAEVIEQSNASDQEKRDAVEALPDLVVETPRTQKAASVFRTFLQGVAPEVTTTIGQVLGSALSSAAKGILHLP